MADRHGDWVVWFVVLCIPFNLPRWLAALQLLAIVLALALFARRWWMGRAALRRHPRSRP